MKVLAIVGSLREGNSNYLVDQAIKTIQEVQSPSNIQIQKIHLKDIRMNFCNGCLICDTTGECVYDDDMTALVSQVRLADAFIFSTPARWRLLSGEMKTFLDRLNPLAVNEELKGKRAIIIAVGQSEAEDSKSIKSAAESLSFFCEDAGIELIDTVIACGCYDRNDIQKKTEYIGKCNSAAKRLVGYK